MLDTSILCHQSFLRGIKKEYSGTVSPVDFFSLWNEEAQPKWISDCVSMKEGIEVTEKKINDLEPIRREYVFNPVGTNLFTVPDGVILDENGNATEKHMRTLNVMFKVNYDLSTSQECELTGISEWLDDTRIMRSDQKSYSRRSAFRRPKDKKPYYDKVNKQIRFITDVVYGSPAVKMDIEYLMYPNDISLTDNSILPDYARQEIVQICVKLYLEKVKDQRLSTYIQAGMNQPITNI